MILTSCRTIPPTCAGGRSSAFVMAFAITMLCLMDGAATHTRPLCPTASSYLRKRHV
jgi:hypothetical protein